jgi:hypothetical protein
MNITESRLRQIIKEEYLRATPIKAGQLMSEHRAMYLAEQVMQEGLWDSLKAAIKGLGAGAKSAAGAVGGIAMDAVKSAAAPMINAAKAGKAAIDKIADDASRAAAEAAADSLKTSLQAEITKQTAQIIQKLVKSGKSEEEAKAQASGIVTAALSAAVGEAGQASG